MTITLYRSLFDLGTRSALGALVVLAACSKQEEGPAPAEAQARSAPQAAEPAEPAEAPAPEPAAEEAEQPAEAEAVAQNGPPEEKNCGGEDEPLCPLGQWMDDNTRTAAEDGDLEALEAAFHKIEFMAPDPSWNEGEDAWIRISRIGAVKAAEGDLRGSRRQCKGCHDVWRDKYEEQYWHVPVPELPPNAEEGDPDFSL